LVLGIHAKSRPNLYDPTQLLPLYLPFVTLLNQSGFVGKIQALSQSLEEQVGKRICVEQNLDEDVVDEIDDGKAEPAASASASASASPSSSAAAVFGLSSAAAGTTQI
jgi:hypothetical protein